MIIDIKYTGDDLLIVNIVILTPDVITGQFHITKTMVLFAFSRQ